MSVRRVMCACGRIGTVKGTDTAYELAWSGWEHVAGTWSCAACVWDRNRYTIVTDQP